MSEHVVVTHALRTPIGRFLGGLSGLTAPAMGAAVLRAVLDASGVPPEDVDEVLVGCARQAGCGPNPGRQAALLGGLPETVIAHTVNMACGSGLHALHLAAQSIVLGEARICIAGGTESMSRVPYYLDRARTGYRIGHGEVVDGMVRDGFLCPISDRLMGETAETLARKYGIGREEQDTYAVRSQNRAEQARREGRYAAEIVPVEAPDARGRPVRIEADEHPRDGATVASLARLPAVFDREAGTVTAGNASGITDGASMLLVMGEEEARRRGLRPLARLAGYARAGVDPAVMGIGPVPAVRRLLERKGWGLGDFDLVELNEAFAAQVLACDRELGLDAERLNVNGGSIALGHPIGCTGARIVTTLLHEMGRRKARRGLATLCISGGLGLAAAFEN